MKEHDFHIRGRGSLTLYKAILRLSDLFGNKPAKLGLQGIMIKFPK